MKTRIISCLMVCVLLSATGFAFEQRRPTRTVQPTYPALAKQMHVSGTVKLEVTVTPTGTVRNVKVVGGHPLLLDAAQQSVKNWHYEQASAETVEQIVINFTY